MAKHFHFGLICPKYIVSEVSCFFVGFFWWGGGIQMHLCKHKQCWHDLFRETFSKHEILIHYFPIVL